MNNDKYTLSVTFSKSLSDDMECAELGEFSIANNTPAMRKALVKLYAEEMQGAYDEVMLSGEFQVDSLIIDGVIYDADGEPIIAPRPRLWTALIRHKGLSQFNFDDTTVLHALSEEGIDRKVADYCRENWLRAYPVGSNDPSADDNVALTDAQIAECYFNSPRITSTAHNETYNIDSEYLD